MDAFTRRQMKSLEADLINKRAQAIHNQVMNSSSGVYGTWNTRTETAVAKVLLLRGAFMKDGGMWEYHAKSLGCGVQKLTIAEA